MRGTIILSLRLILFAVILPWQLGPAIAQDAAKRGAYVFTVAGCAHCHTKGKGAENWLAGGRELPTPFGSFFTPNITPDKKTGIGNWSAKNFHNALRHGERPDGSSYFPAFPFGSYSGMRDKDIADLWAYMKTVPAIKRKNRPHQLGAPFGWRWMLRFWRLLYFDTGPLKNVARKPADWNRGRYLVGAMAHCAECHSPRNWLGGIVKDKRLAGGVLFQGKGKKPEVAPNITPHAKYGIGSWSTDDLDTVLSLGMLPDGDFLGSEMTVVIDNMAKMSDVDRQAMVIYLRSFPAINYNPATN